MTQTIKRGETSPSLRRLFGVVRLSDGVTPATDADVNPPPGSLQVTVNGAAPVAAAGVFVGDGTGEYYYELSPGEVAADAFVGFKLERSGYETTWFVGRVGDAWTVGETDPVRLRQPLVIFDDASPPALAQASVTASGQLQTALSSLAFADAPGTLQFVASGLHYYQGVASDAATQGTRLIRFQKASFQTQVAWVEVTPPSSTSSLSPVGEETGWTSIENALHAAVVFGTGVTASRVIWDYYTQTPRPAPPFIELSISDIEMQGEDWIVYDDAPDPQPGAEVRSRVRGHRSAYFTIQAFGPFGRGSTSWRVLSRFISSLALLYPTLDEAGVGVGNVGAIQSVEGKKGGVLEPRATCRIEIYVASELEGRETFIERVHLNVTAGPATKALWIPNPP